MYISHQKGCIGELKVELRAIEKGYIVSRPTIEARYDLVIDIDGKLKRVQVKYLSRKRKETYELDLRKETRNNGNRKVYKAEEVDALLVYIQPLDKVLWIEPKDFVDKTAISFREKKPKKNYPVKLIKDYIW